MPITKSAQKAWRQSKKRRTQNLKRKSKFKASVKEFRKSIAGGDFEKAKSLLPQVYKALDKAAKTNTIRKNKSSRLKSRLSKLIKKSK